MTRPASLPPSQGRQLHELILATAPKRVVEIGSFLGLSTLWIASALRILGAGQVHAVDPFEPKLPFAKSHCGCIVNSAKFVASAVTRAGLDDFVHLEPGYSRQFAQSLQVTQSPEIDFLFIDGDHSVGGCLDDFVSYCPFVRRGGHILVHDIHPARCGWPGPRYLLDHFIAGSPRFKIEEIVTEPDYGMALITKLTDDQLLPALTHMKAELLIYPHRAVQAAARNTLIRRTLKPLLTAFKLRLAQRSAG
jgi:predicted O-methyltransferase YrrM